MSIIIINAIGEILLLQAKVEYSFEWIIRMTNGNLWNQQLNVTSEPLIA